MKYTDTVDKMQESCACKSIHREWRCSDPGSKIAMQVKAVNGVTVSNLCALMEAVEACKDKYLKFHMEYNQLVIMETEAARKATKDILTMHYIPHDRSEDLRTAQKGGTSDQ